MCRYEEPIVAEQVSSRSSFFSFNQTFYYSLYWLVLGFRFYLKDTICGRDLDTIRDRLNVVK